MFKSCTLLLDRRRFLLPENFKNQQSQSALVAGGTPHWPTVAMSFVAERATIATAALADAGWTLRVRTMTGDALSVLCANGAFTRISDIKRSLAAKNPAWPVARQRLLLPLRPDNVGTEPSAASSAASTSSSACELDSSFAPLADNCTLAAYRLKDGATLELLIADIAWNKHQVTLISTIENAGERFFVPHGICCLGPETAAAISWTIINKVRAFHCIKATFCCVCMAKMALIKVYPRCSRKILEYLPRLHWTCVLGTNLSFVLNHTRVPLRSTPASAQST